MSGCYGQDWASYQDDNPSTAGLAFVFVKRTEGMTYLNPKAVSQISAARSHGLVVGHYHYPHMANSPAAEADRFLAVSKPAPGDVLCLDWEGYDAANKGVPFSTQVAYKRAFLARVQAAQPTHQVGTYCNTDYLDRDPGGVYGDFLWIATAGRPAGQPGISRKWLFHQYGASGVDRDYCPLTAAQLDAWAHAKETKMATLDADDKKYLEGLVGKVAPAVWTVPLPEPGSKTGETHTAGDYLRYNDPHYAAVIATIKAQGAATSTAVVQALTPLIGKNVDTATVVTAVQQAIADATVQVNVDVTGPNPPATPAA